MASIEKRIGKDGDISYRVKVRMKGFETESKSFTRLTDARIWGQDKEAQMRSGRYKKPTSTKSTLHDAIEKYKSEILVHRKKTTVNQIHYLDWCVPRQSKLDK